MDVAVNTMTSSLFFSLPIEYPKLVFKDSSRLFEPFESTEAFELFSSVTSVILELRAPSGSLRVPSVSSVPSRPAETSGASGGVELRVSSLRSAEKFSSGFFPNFIDFVAMVSELLYPGIFSFRISMLDGIRIILGKIAKFRTTFVAFTAVRMFEIRTVLSSSTTVSFASFAKSSWVCRLFAPSPTIFHRVFA